MSREEKPRDKEPRPYAPYVCDKQDVIAMQSLMEGEADSVAQKRALDVVIKITNMYDMSYRLSDRDTAFAEGRRFVGSQIVKLLKLNTAIFDEPKEKQE